MGYFRKKLERRTFSQDRYYILIKRQKAGQATFNELTELDEIVNRVPDIREKVIMENFGQDIRDTDEQPNGPVKQDNAASQNLHRHNLWNKVASLIHRAFKLQITSLNISGLNYRIN
jgi:hypothetical protein